MSLYILSLKKDLWVYNADCGVGKASKKYNKKNGLNQFDIKIYSRGISQN